MSAVASKNLFDLLGNDIDDESGSQKAPLKEVVKQSTTSKKREAVAPSKPTTTTTTSTGGSSSTFTGGSGGSGRGGYGNRRGRGDGNDAAFRDRGAGRQSNRSRFDSEGGAPRGDRGERGERGDRPYRGRGRGGGGGGGGGAGRGREYDRHSATGRTDTDKQVAQGWGAVEGSSEWNDEQAGQNIATQEASDDFVPVDVEGGGGGGGEEGDASAQPEPEPEDTTKSFADYMAEKAVKAPVAELPEARSANEGSRDNKKWAAAKELKKEEGEEYFVGGKAKAKGNKHRKEKNVLEIDQRFVEHGGSRGRGGDRGGRGGGRGEGRGGGGGRGGGRGEARGDRRGGGRGGSGGSVNIQDTGAFPSLGK